MKNNIWDKKCIFSPSLICLDMCNLQEQVRTLEENGADMLHIDILDGHFSPSMPLGLETVRQLRALTDLPFDCHVMVRGPEYFVEELLDIGVQQIVFHVETADHIDGMLNLIHAHGVRAGVALKPATPLSVLDYVLEKCDTVLLMLINPGYASVKGEKQVPYASRKVRELSRRIHEGRYDTRIEIDGRISKENIMEFGRGYADIFVTGSTCLKKDDLGGTYRSLCELRKDVVSQDE